MAVWQSIYPVTHPLQSGASPLPHWDCVQVISMIARPGHIAPSKNLKPSAIKTVGGGLPPMAVSQSHMY